MTEFAGIELGGTKTIVVRGAPGVVRERLSFPTTGPEATLARCAEIITEWHEDRAIEALGIASFGPVRVAVGATDYGTILTTPKPHWSGAPVLARLRACLDVPMAIDTDVNAAALAEYRLGAAQGCTSVVYITVGTGLGGGVLVDGQPVHGLLHPEIGHLRTRRFVGDRFAGSCRFHGDCIEGLISGPALATRFARHPADVPSEDSAWKPVIADLAELLTLLLLTYSPQRIVLGGGVMQRQRHLLAPALGVVRRLLATYLDGVVPDTLGDIVVPAQLGDDAGPTGALLLARNAFDASAESGFKTMRSARAGL